MWKNVKAFIAGIVAGVLSVLGFILGRKIFCNRRTTSGNGESLSTAETEAERTAECNRAAGDINQELTELTERNADILERIREQKLSK
ncbi:hypothetical protein [Treponema sp.]|uniref:hypothetical protein n=1 Tax=Treponema sp. TaxID=166 RepID=UPI0025D60896|nr:hypothetical protein [Treponema sp.]MCR5219185.1 hypothetical protein [Treponema sp.]